MYKRILIATDGSKHSQRAADHALRIAACDPNSIIEIIYIMNADQIKADVLEHWDERDRTDIRRERVKAVEEKVKQAGVTYETKIIPGDPGPAIVKYANENHIDLIVLGSRGLNALQELVLGSVSHKVAKRANCPVMIVK